MSPFFGTFHHFSLHNSDSRFFLKNPKTLFFYVYQPVTPCKKSEKSNEQFSQTLSDGHILHTHTHTLHTHARTLTHAHTHTTHTHTHSYTHTHTQAHTCTHTKTQSNSHSITHYSYAHQSSVKVAWNG